MGWQDDPIVGEDVAPQPALGAGDPEVAPAQPTTPEPSMGQVAANAVPKGIANFLNTPITLSNLIMQGIAALPGAGHLTGLQEAAANPELKANGPMDAMKEAGLVRPEAEPQTGPQRIVDAAIQTAIGAAAVPAGSVPQIVKGAVVGATSGAAAQTAKELTGSDLLAVVIGAGTPFAVKAVTDPSKRIILPQTAQDTLKQAQAAGYVVEPSKVRTPSSKLESVAGKASIAQEAVERNQTVTDQMAAKSLGLPENTPLSPSLLGELKKRVIEPYKQVDLLHQQARESGTLEYFPRYHSASLMDELTAARQEASALWKSYGRNHDIGVMKAAKAADGAVDSIEADIERVAEASGQPELLTQLKGARMLYARIMDVESAMNVGTGHVSAPILGRMLDKGKPLGDQLAVVGKFANAFPRVAREAEGVPPSSVSGTDAASAAVLSMGGAAAAGHPAGAVAGGAPLLRGPARNTVLSPGYQKDLLTPPKPPTPAGVTAGRATITGTLAGDQE